MKSLKWLLAGALIFFAASMAEATPRIDIVGKSFKKLTIAVPPFKSEAGDKLKSDMSDLLNKDLDLSGFFIVTPPSLFDKEFSSEGVEKKDIKFPSWRSVGVELLCKARIQEAGGEITVEAWLYDTLEGNFMFAKRYKAGKDEWRRVVHRLADEIILAVTGEKGIMGSRILFVAGTRFHKELYTADIDGANPKKLTSYKSITLSPSISSDGKYLSFTSYKEGRPNLYVVDVGSNREVRSDKQEGMKLGTHWLNKNTLGFSHTSGKYSTIYGLDVTNGTKKQLLRKEGILASPTFSPDGSKMAFLSNMYGSPQIFLMDMASGEIKRLTYSGNYNSAPSFSPKGDLIAFVSSLEGSFEICIMNADGGNQRVLTSGAGAVNDSPSFSPCGRYIIYSSKNGSRSTINLMLFNGENQRVLKLLNGNEDQPKFMP
jgi:TolB protein